MVDHNPPELSRSVVPPGGFIFDQALADGSYTRLEGASLDQVQELILRYRQVNGMLLPAGTLVTPEAVWRDYHSQVCTKYPWLCSAARTMPQATQEVATGLGGWEMLYSRMQRWMDEVRSRGQDWVDQKTAHDRAERCLACPQHVLWQTNCGSCNQNLTQQSAAVRGARRLAQDSVLRGCRVFGTLQEVAVWLQSPGGEAKYEAPHFCWRK